MKETTFDIDTEQVTTIRREGELVAVVSHNMKKRTQVFSTCTDMSAEEIKKTLEALNGSQPKA